MEIPSLNLDLLAEEHMDEHVDEVFCDVCGVWYDKEDPCPSH